MPATHADDESPSASGSLALVDRMRADLVSALKAGDQPTRVSVLRTTLAAIANAEAPTLDDRTHAPTRGRPNEVPRLALGDADLERILAEEIADRRHTLDQYEQAQREEPAALLRNEIAILVDYLP
jgi:uncharacterized protein YqeY